MAHFHLWLLNRQVALISPATATPVMLNATMQIMQIAAEHGAAFAHRGQLLPHFETSLEAARNQLDALVLERATAAAQLQTLNFLQSRMEGSNCSSPGLDYFPPTGILPPLSSASVAETDLEAAQERSLKNIRDLPLPPSPASEFSDQGFADLLYFLKFSKLKKKDSGGLIAQHVLCSIEALLFRCGAIEFWSCARITQTGVKDLVEIVEIYRTSKCCIIIEYLITNKQPMVSSLFKNTATNGLIRQIFWGDNISFVP